MTFLKTASSLLICVVLLTISSIVHAYETSPPPGTRSVGKAMEDSAASVSSDGSVNIYSMDSAPDELVVSEGTEGIISLKINTPQKTNPSAIDAKELRLKIRELTSQLLAQQQPLLAGKTALISSFVSLDDFDKTSTFGRYFAEQLYYELNQRGISVREYRLSKDIILKEDQGEFVLTRSAGKISPAKDYFIVTGTYYNDANSVFVNARIVDPKSGNVLQTANLLLNNNKTTQKMLAKSFKKTSASPIKVRSLQEKIAPKISNPFDMGEDIH